jgi:glutamate dehydrogenase
MTPQRAGVGTRKMSVDATDRRIAIKDLLTAAQKFESFRNGTQIEAAAEAFITQIAEDATEDDVQGLTPEDLAALADGFWRWTSQKRADAQEIRLIEGKGEAGRPLGRDILEICGPDMPFLVDSVMGEIGAQGVEVRAMFHPIVHLSRDGDGLRGHGGVSLAESLIQIHMPPVAPSKRDAILMGVRETLADVRLSVSDFQAMRGRMNNAIRELSVAKTKASADEIGETISFLKWLSQDHFIFFGVRSYDYPRDSSGALASDEPDIREDLNLGILRDPLRMVLRRLNEPSVLTDKVKAYMASSAMAIMAKCWAKSALLACLPLKLMTKWCAMCLCCAARLIASLGALTWWRAATMISAFAISSKITPAMSCSRLKKMTFCALRWGFSI